MSRRGHRQLGPVVVSVRDAQAFAARWLPAWTGNEPERLADFYTDDAAYLDPAVPQGLRGRAQILGYFTKLLARNPDWVWTQREAVPMEGGFVNFWRAVIPRPGRETVTVDGVCLVWLDLASQKISRNEVHFDASLLK